MMTRGNGANNALDMSLSAGYNLISEFVKFMFDFAGDQLSILHVLLTFVSSRISHRYIYVITNILWFF